MRIKFPTRFNVDYPKENKNYYNKNKANENLKELLIKASKGYCMYCGNRILLGNLNYGQLEHSIEKVQTTPNKTVQYLTHCKYNISIACSICNQKYKSTDIKKISINYDYTCPEMCINQCDEYEKNFNNHYDANKIILMPHGMSKNNLSYDIEYNLISLRYEPSTNLDYTREDKQNIKHHISKFDLNGKNRCKESLIDICTYVIENKRIPNKTSSINNIIGENFIDYLNEINNKNSINDVILICQTTLLNFKIRGKDK